MEEEAENSGESYLMHRFSPLYELQLNILTFREKMCQLLTSEKQRLGGDSEVKENLVEEQRERENHCNNRRKTVPHSAHLNRSQEALNEKETKEKWSKHCKPR